MSEHLVWDIVLEAKSNAEFCDSHIVEGSSIDVSSNNRHPSIKRSLIYFSAIVERRITRLALGLHILQLWTLNSDDLFEIECSYVGLGLG